LLAIPLGMSLWSWRLPSRLLLALRLATLVFLLLALAGLAMLLPGRAGTVIVVADRSLSMPPDSQGSQKLAIDLIQGSMAPDERLGVVAFGQKAALERPPQPAPSPFPLPLVGGEGRVRGPKFAGFANDVGRDASNLAEGLATALALIPTDTPGKILILSDGRWTGRDPVAVAARAAARGIALDYRPLQRTAANDVAIARVDLPTSVGPGESFLVTAWIHAPTAQEVSYELRRGKQRISSGKRQLASGLNRLSFRDQAADSGVHAYTLVVTGEETDPVPENNTARLLVSIKGPRPVLLATSSPESGLARLLQVGGLKVKAKRPEDCTWSLEELSQYAAVLLENVPAEKVGPRGMRTLAAWVQETGAGLMMTGGRSSYAPGGYFRSPLEPIMPVSMELRKEHRKLALAIVVALDRSGSMAIPVGGGKVKMDLANLGTVQVLDLLSPSDEFGVIAVDTAPHIIQELALIADKGPVRDRILRIQSMGGGIYVYEALAAASKMVLGAKAGTKHIILFADAADAEQPGDYQRLVEECQKAGITVSVIGLGRESDKDGTLLKDIARRGGGRCFFSNDPAELPRLFAQDTFVVARSAFLDEPTPIQLTAGLTALSGKSFSRPPALGGYNLCYVRPGANLASVTLDEYHAPVVAAWPAGTGRVLCYTGEADGVHTGAIAKWQEVGEFFTSLTRWTIGHAGTLPSNMILTQELRKGIAVVELHLDPERKDEPISQLPKVSVLRAKEAQTPSTAKTSMYWSGADTLAVEIPLDGTETVVTAVDVPGHGAAPLPPVCLPYSPEYAPAEAGTGLAALERLARASGGKERLDLAGIWSELPKQARMMPIGHWLLLAAVVLILLEVLERRTGLVSRGGRLVCSQKKGAARQPRRLPSSHHRPAPVTLEHTGATSPEDPVPASPSVEAASTGLLEALRKAGERARGRNKN
jgi:Mg-chelatase subunit ChlD